MLESRNRAGLIRSRNPENKKERQRESERERERKMSKGRMIAKRGRQGGPQTSWIGVGI